MSIRYPSDSLMRDTNILYKLALEDNRKLKKINSDLLEACKALYNAKGSMTRLSKALIKAEAAIAKAEGTEP